MGMKDIFKKIAASKASASGKWFKPGIYDLTLLKLIIKDGQDGTFFLGEHLIDASTADPDAKDDKGGAIAPNPAGTEVTYIVNLDNVKAQGSQYSNVKAYVLALMGYTEAEVSDEAFSELLEALVGTEPTPDTDAEGKPVMKDGKPVMLPAGHDAQPMRGKKVQTTCWNKPQKKDKTKTYTNHRWTHVPQTADEVAARRADLDRKPAEPAAS